MKGMPRKDRIPVLFRGLPCSSPEAIERVESMIVAAAMGISVMRQGNIFIIDEYIDSTSDLLFWVE